MTLEALTKVEGKSIRDIKWYRHFFNNTSQEDLHLLIAELGNRPLQTMNPDGDKRWDGRIISVNDTDGIVEFIIRGRNNLFHGDKGPDEERDSLIIRYGNRILKPVVEAMLTNYEPTA